MLTELYWSLLLSRSVIVSSSINYHMFPRLSIREGLLCRGYYLRLGAEESWVLSLALPLGMPVRQSWGVAAAPVDLAELTISGTGAVTLQQPMLQYGSYKPSWDPA